MALEGFWVLGTLGQCKMALDGFRYPGTVQGGPGGAQVLGPLPAQALLALGDSLAGSELKHLALPLGSPIPQRVLTQPFLAGALCTLHTSLTVINAFHSLIP